MSDSAPVDPLAPACPQYRRLRVYAFDPSLETRVETAMLNRVTLKVPWERLDPGPIGEYVEVVDCDPASGCVYAPVNLEHPHLLARDGLPPAEGNPQFHQQMVYAVSMATIRHFEKALGRAAMWSQHDPSTGCEHEHTVERLRLYPHALRGANAYYSPLRKAILFGYFPATAKEPGKMLPRGVVFTCLSHGVIAHEVTHALLDGMYRLLLEPSNPDVLAFHEAFSDIVALFQHFSMPEVLKSQIARTRGDLASQNLLGQLAQQYGEATGKHGALRDALGKVNEKTGKWEPLEPDPSLMDTVWEAHDRGSILVAAVFDAFLAMYRARIADLLRIATAGSGQLPPGELQPDLVNRLAQEAAKTARHVLTMCIRALDYCPPVDLTFGEYLRALITADFDLVRDDDLGYRIAFIEAFRRRGIYPRDVRTLSEGSLLWQPPAVLSAGMPDLKHVCAVEKVVESWTLTTDSRGRVLEEVQRARKLFRKRLKAALRGGQEKKLGVDFRLRGPLPPEPVRKEGPRGWGVSGVRPARRVGPDGQLLTDVIVELTHARWVKAPIPGRGGFWFRGGCTLVFDMETGRARYCIRKDIHSKAREKRQAEFLTTGAMPSLQATYFGALEAGGEPFAFLHGEPDGAQELP